MFTTELIFLLNILTFSLHSCVYMAKLLPVQCIRECNIQQVFGIGEHYLPSGRPIMPLCLVTATSLIEVADVVFCHSQETADLS